VADARERAVFLPAGRIVSIPTHRPSTPIAARATETRLGFGASLFPHPTSKATNSEDESDIEFRKFTIWNYL
jgi:hypothetical protein